MKKFIHILLNLLFPQNCLGCGLKNEILCGECFERIDYPSLPRSAGPILAATDYNDEIAKKAIWTLKYRKVRPLAEPLAELMSRRLFGETGFPLGHSVSKLSDWMVIPIPLSKKRMKKRGFNQSELIAKQLSDKVSVRIETDVLYKIKDTPSQVSIKDREKRLNNLAGSFGVKNMHLINGKNVILIDDVTTTGATIKEARKILRETGAKKVIAMVVARG